MNELNDDLNKTNQVIEKIKNEDVGEATQKAYLEYAVSVIVDRALPDARDGLKPVHRRILYAMNQLKISHTSAYKKSARIVGDVIGKYHPHGDIAVYDAKVRMAQPFSMRTPLIDGQGNFGSLDGDSPAAMRYTEARMGSFPSKYMFNDLFKDTVDFVPNYDGTEFEPSVLSLQYPNLIINGVQGIAVGMASSLPPHNPIEAMECVKYKVSNRITNQEDSLDELIAIMPAPDFPTGAHIHGLEDVKTAWESGIGKTYLRAKWEEEELSGGRTLIIITELPYQVKKQELVNKMEELAKPHPETKVAKIEGIQSVEDGSDKTGVRVEIVIKNEYDAELVMNELLKQTDLQKTISYNCTVLTRDNGRLKPETLGLNELFDIFIDHRLDIILKRSIYDDNKLAAREHILNGLRKAIDPKNIDNVISTIRNNKDVADAKLAIIELLDVDDIQAQEILQIRLSRLVGLEIDKIDSELENIKIERAVLNNLINNEIARLNVVMEESDEMVTEFSKVQSPDLKFYKNLKYPFRDRLSTFDVEMIKSDKATLTKEEECNIIITSKGYMRRVPLSELSSMNRGARGKKQIKLTEGDFIQKSINSHSHASLLFVTNTGKAYVKPAYDIISDSEKGRHVNWILDLADSANEKIVDVIPVDFEVADQKVAMFTKKGLVKVTKLSEYASATRKGGIKGISLRDGDSILCFTVCNEEDTLFMVNSNNLIIRFPVSTIKVIGRTGSGVKGMNLDKNVSIVGAGQIRNEGGYIVSVSSNGLIKVTKAEQYRIQTRGGKGLRVMKANERSGQLFNSFYVDDLEDDVVSTTKKGYSNARPLKEYTVTNRSTTGVKLLSLDDDDILVDVFNSPHQEDLEDDLDYTDTENVEDDILPEDSFNEDEEVDV